MTIATSLALPQAPASRTDLICFSHLRWDFVTQRPQHLMRRFAATHRVFFWEEAIATDHHLPYLEVHAFEGTTVQSIRPRVPHTLPVAQWDKTLAELLDQFCALAGISKPLLWFYSPMFWQMAQHIDASIVIYDCMDELSAFRFAPADLVTREQDLIAAADLMLTGGISLWEAKRDRHDNIHPFPSAVDTTHFAQARTELAAPDDQRDLPSPRLGYYGVIDERLDLPLIKALAEAHPTWSIVMLGPLAKISPTDLPQAPNLHWLGQKAYEDLPAYVAGWDVALMPFVLNEATRFISPTKTPEYLAAGRLVVSTAIRDVERSYGHLKAVSVVTERASFLSACAAAIKRPKAEAQEARAEADALLAECSWDESHRQIARLIDTAQARPAAASVAFPAPYLRRTPRRYDVTICGAGFAGASLARQLAEVSDQRVLLIDRRDHIGGNAYDHLDAAGILIHRYGPHIFHTNSTEVFDFLSRFTAWRPYEHRVLAQIKDRRVPMPLNRTSINQLFDLDLQTEAQAAEFFAARAEDVGEIRTSRDVVVSAIGQELYETFFQGYTRKQWGLDPTELDKSVTSRIPTRTNTDDRYFTDRFQAMPREGYTRMFERLLDHPNIDIALSTEFKDIPPQDRGDLTIYTGPIDAYFDYCYGRLPYRSLKFVHQTLPQRKVLPVGVVNYPDEATPYTRVTEYKHLTGQVHPMSSVSYEYPCAEGDPYYPIPRPENQALFRRYEALARAEPNVIFAGRLGSYRYYNMDQVVGQALAIHRRLSPRFATASADGNAARVSAQ